MEEDIKEILIALDNTTKKQLDKAIENADKEWSEMELEEDIKILEEHLEHYHNILNSLHVDKLESFEVEQAIENLIARYKETKQELESVKEIYYTQKEIETNYIPKSKVKEKIDGKFKEAKGLYERGVQPQAQFTMKLLRDLEKELLED